jgi:hypothetical protein
VAKMTRRFGAHEVKRGPFKGGIHHSTKRYSEFSGELAYLSTYLPRRLLPLEPEEFTMQGIILILQNLIEHELEQLIVHVVQDGKSIEDRKFLQRIIDGHVSFKTKYEWLQSRTLIDKNDCIILEEVRVLRNNFVHTRPTEGRRRHCYRGFPLLTKHSNRKLFTDVEMTLQRIRGRSGRSSRWMTVPPGYAQELNWPKEFIEALKGKETP